MTQPPSPADPRAFLQALGSRPNPSAVQAAELTLLRLESDLSSKLASLADSPHQSEEEAKLRREVEREKLPYKSIVSLFELHQIYEGLLNNTDDRTRKTLEVLNSFTERSHSNVEQEPADGQPGLVDFGVLEAAALKADITKLDLNGRLLDQALPSSFGCKFINLVSLDLSKNQLKDLPSSIGEMVNLEILDLQSNQLSTLPDAIGLLGNLKVLNVSGNMLVAFPESLGGCRSLKELNAGFNQLAHLSPRFGYDFAIYLENLCLHSNKLTFLPPSLCKLKRLKVLDLHFNNLKSLPSSLGSLLSLEKLNLSNNFSDFGGALPESIGDLVLLTELDLSFNQIRVLPDSVGSLENLKILKVENNPLVVPPLDVVEHSMEALLEYMQVRWKTSQIYNEEEVCASPRSMGLKVGGIRSPFTGISFAHWFVGRCSGRSAASLGLHHKQLNSYRH